MSNTIASLNLDELNTQINDYENKLELLKNEKIKRFNFIKYFNISKSDQKLLGNNFNIDVNYEYNDHTHDEYGHDANAYFKVTFGDKEYLEINYTEAQGASTESRYTPTIDCEINGTKKARNIFFKNLEDTDPDDYHGHHAYLELRDIIQQIVED